MYSPGKYTGVTVMTAILHSRTRGLEDSIMALEGSIFELDGSVMELEGSIIELEGSSWRSRRFSPGVELDTPGWARYCARELKLALEGSSLSSRAQA